MGTLLHNGDCLDVMKSISSNSIDMIFADLPYGTTKCKWDSVIPLKRHVKEGDNILYEDDFILRECKNGRAYSSAKKEFDNISFNGLWEHYERIIKDRGSILLFSQSPYDKVLGSSNLSWLRYEWIWEKTQATGHLNAKKMPMKAHENILVFYKHLPTYNPQKTQGHKPINSYTKYVATQNNTELYGDMKQEISGGGETSRFPRSVQIFSSDKQTCKLHPTQKPLALCEYMIETYTDEGDIVLDNVMGSGTNGVASKNLKRNFIGIEKDEKYFEIAKERIFA